VYRAVQRRWRRQLAPRAANIKVVAVTFGTTAAGVMSPLTRRQGGVRGTFELKKRRAQQVCEGKKGGGRAERGTAETSLGSPRPPTHGELASRSRHPLASPWSRANRVSRPHGRFTCSCATPGGETRTRARRWRRGAAAGLHPSRQRRTHYGAGVGAVADPSADPATATIVRAC